MKTIRDAIHGNIVLSDFEVSILDAPEVQRLRRIKQLGFTYLVYPSATHTRFEHSLGTFYLAGRLAEHLGLEKDDTEKIKLAALLHDLGHGPFSHSSENAINMHHPLQHEEVTIDIIKNSEIADKIKSIGFNPAEIAKLSIGQKKPLGQIIAGDIDVDRMDYLVRDSYYTGAGYGAIDLERLLQILKLYKRKLVVGEDGLSAAESLVRARYAMHPTVYHHHASRIANSMFCFAVVYCLDAGLFTVKELSRMDDAELVTTLRNSEGFSSEIITHIENRKLYKRAVVLDKETLNSNYRKFLKLSKENLLALKIELSEAAGLKRGEVLLDIPRPLYPQGTEIEMLHKGNLVNLSEVSPLVKSLYNGQWEYWNIGVYCEEENVKKVKKASEGILLGY